MRQKILFIDRDGTLIEEPPDDCQVDRLEKLAFLPGVISVLRQLALQTDYRLVMVSNQDGLGTENFPLTDFMPPHQWMLKTLAGEGVVFDEILIDDSLPEACSPRRKPQIGMVEKYLHQGFDRESSYVIGDRATDMEFAANMGIQGIFLGKEIPEGLPVVLHTDSWEEIGHFLLSGSRRASVCRKTKETLTEVSLDLNGSGVSRINTGIAFFDHMLEQVSRHGGVDLDIRTVGDLAVDEHHTVEDTALAMGRCFDEALGSRKGIGRYGFMLPMDDARALVCLDFGGRNCLEWKVEFQREYVGDLPTEMVRHFFSSFCQEARCNLHVEASGENTHHLVESVFKAFGRCVGTAVKRSGNEIPSSKGVL